MTLTLRWLLDKRSMVTNQAKPGEAVRLESLDATHMNKVAQVFHIPEPFVRRIIHKLLRRAGIPQSPLRFIENGTQGPLSEPWIANQLPPPMKPTRYVATLPDKEGSSGQLLVTDKVIWKDHRELDGRAGLDMTALTAAAGVPIPVRLDASGRRRVTREGAAYGMVDPSVEVIWLTIGDGGDQSLNDYLELYLSSYERAFDLPPGTLFDAVRDEYRDCFEDPAPIGVEIAPSSFDIAEGQYVAVDIDFYPQGPGRALAAVGLIDTADRTLFSVSDLMVITYSEEGLLFIEAS